MAAINAINKAPVRSAKAYVARAKKEEVALPPKPKVKTNEELVDEIPFIDHPSCTAQSIRGQVLGYLNSPNLKGLLGDYNSNPGFSRPWTHADMLLFYTQHCERVYKLWLQNEEKRKSLEEKRKNWNPSDAEKLGFLMRYRSLRSKTVNGQDGYDASLCTCCGAMQSHYPASDYYSRIRWQTLKDGAAPTGIHGTESLRIKDAETGKDLYISWNNE
jgi:hypothetical protein